MSDQQSKMDDETGCFGSVLKIGAASAALLYVSCHDPWTSSGPACAYIDIVFGSMIAAFYQFMRYYVRREN